MKNLFALSLVFCLIVFSVIFTQNFAMQEVGEVTLVANLQKSYPVCSSVIESGNKSYITADLKYFNHLLNNVDNIHGFTLKLTNTTFQQFIKNYNVKIIKQETVQNKQVVYGYTTKFANHIFVDNKMCNVQIVCDNTLTVGVPAILDSF